MQRTHTAFLPSWDGEAVNCYRLENAVRCFRSELGMGVEAGSWLNRERCTKSQEQREQGPQSKRKERKNNAHFGIPEQYMLAITA